MIIFVSGMEHSNAVLACRLLSLMGAYFGPENAMPQDDPASSPESSWIRKDIKLIIDTLSAGGDSQSAFCEARRLFQAMERQSPCIVFEPRLFSILPAIVPVHDCVAHILVGSNPINTAVSLHEAHGQSIPLSLALWEHHTIETLKASQDIPTHIFSPSAFMKSPSSSVESLHDFLINSGASGLHLPSEKEISYLAATYFHYEENISEQLQSSASSTQLKLWESLSTGNIISPAQGLTPQTLTLLEEHAIARSAVAEVKQLAQALKEAKVREKRLKKEADAFARRLKEVGREYEKSLALVRQSLKTITEDLKQAVDLRRQSAKKFRYWMRKLKNDMRDIRTSKRWLVGNALVGPLEFLLGRSNQKTALDNMEKIMVEFESMYCSSKTSAPASPQRDPFKLINLLEKDVNAVIQSTRWVIGSKVVRAIEKVLGRKANRLAIDNMLDKIQQFQAQNNGGKGRKCLPNKNTIAQLEKDFMATMHSRRWQLGNFIVRLMEMVLFRSKTLLATDQIALTLQMLKQWEEATRATSLANNTNVADRTKFVTLQQATGKVYSLRPAR